ncbi:MAG: ABC transporter ATP-binding protein, partial [Gaiellaceae bacterium]
GSFVALLGPSGCGKTTTMNMISGLEDPSGGEIYFDQHPMSNVDPGQRSVGFVFQNYAIFTHMTVSENLAFGLKVRKPKPSSSEIAQEVARVAKIVGIDHALKKKAAALSVNDMQKVALGRSMIVQPSIFLLDEPFSNLDAAFRAYMRAELKRIQHDLGQTMVYVTHDQVEAMGMADRIAVMNLGRLQQYGTPDELYNLPENLFVANFIGSVLMNFVPGEYRGENGGGSVVLTGAGGSTVDVSDRKAAIESGMAAGGKVTLAIRPERLQLVAPDASEARLQAKVNLVEPLGARDVVHVTVDGAPMRASLAPGTRPRVGDAVGLAFENRHAHVFDNDSELALR